MKSKDQQLLEEAYVMIRESYVPYSGHKEDYILVDDLSDSVNKLRQSILNGKGVVVKHIAYRSDLQERGEKVSDHELYLFDQPTDFTQPALILH